jgi:hypothetical protein
MAEGNHTDLVDHFQTMDWLLPELEMTKEKFFELSAERRRHADSANYKYLAGCSGAAWEKCEKYYIKADDTAAYYATIVLDPTLKMSWFEDKWADHDVKRLWIQTVNRFI